MTRSELEVLAREIDSLDHPGRLRLAADLLERGYTRMAYALALGTAAEVGAALDAERRERKGKDADRGLPVGA